jgi:ATP-dependent Clp protease ATP-binding subunit ClpC
MFTAQARHAIVRAQDEARDMGCETVEVEHLLLGLFSDHDRVAGPVFATLGLAVESVRDIVAEQLGVASAPFRDQPLRFSDAAKDAIRFANRIALGQPEIAHLVLAIVGRQENNACEILRLLGVDPARIRFETKRRAWPSGPSTLGQQHRSEVRLVSSIGLESLPQIDFED